MATLEACTATLFQFILNMWSSLKFKKYKKMFWTLNIISETFFEET